MDNTYIVNTFIILEFALSIATTTVGFTASDECDNTMTTTSITMKKWLIIRGIIGLIITIPGITIIAIKSVYTITKRNTKNIKWLDLAVYLFVVLLSLFAISWYLIGFVLLFYSNIECLHDKTPMTECMTFDLLLTIVATYQFIVIEIFSRYVKKNGNNVPRTPIVSNAKLTSNNINILDSNGNKIEIVSDVYV